MGVVTKVEIQSSYTIAYIKTYSDIFHPKTFFLINNPKATLLEDFNSTNTILPNIRKNTKNDINTTHQAENNTSILIKVMDLNHTLPILSSIPSRIDQTQDDVIQVETIEEHTAVEKPTVKKPKRKPVVEKPTVKKPKRKPKRNTSTLDLF